MTVRFSVTRSGEVVELETVAHRGPDSFVETACTAQESASPLPPKAVDFEGGRVGVTWSFFYPPRGRGTKRWWKRVAASNEESGASN